MVLEKNLHKNTAELRKIPSTVSVGFTTFLSYLPLLQFYMLYTVLIIVFTIAVEIREKQICIL